MIELRIQGKSAEILSAEADRNFVTPTAIARAIVETVIREGLTDKILAGVDLKQYHHRRRGRPRVRK